MCHGFFLPRDSLSITAWGVEANCTACAHITGSGVSYKRNMVKAMT